LLHSLLIAAASEPPTKLWNWEGTPFIVGACLLVLFIASRTIEEPHVGPRMPLPFPELFNNISVAGFLASMSFGHILGVLATITLSPLLK
jgi:photosystem I subunit 10